MTRWGGKIYLNIDGVRRVVTWEKEEEEGLWMELHLYRVDGGLPRTTSNGSPRATEKKNCILNVNGP